MPGQKTRKKQASTPKADVSFSAHVTCRTVANCAAASIPAHSRPSLPLLDAKQSKHVLQHGNLSGISRQRRSRTLAPGLVDATPAVLLHLDMHGGIHSHRKSGRSGGLRSFLQGSSRRRRVRLKHERTLSSFLKIINYVRRSPVLTNIAYSCRYSSNLCNSGPSLRGGCR